MNPLVFDTTPRTPVPDEFFCTPREDCFKCGAGGGLRADRIASFVEWAKEHRPALANGSAAGLSPYMCGMDQAVLQREAQDQQNLIAAHLPIRNDPVGPRTFDNFKPTTDTREMFGAVVALSKGAGPRHLLLSGITGAGKSHMLEALCRTVLTAGHSVYYTNALDLLDRLRAAVGSGEGVTELMDFLRSVHLLALDEIGVDSNVTPWGVDYLTDIVDHRYADGSYMIAATNGTTPDQLAEKWGHRLASRLFDRSSGIVRVIWCVAEDYRLKVPA